MIVEMNDPVRERMVDGSKEQRTKSVDPIYDMHGGRIDNTR